MVKEVCLNFYLPLPRRVELLCATSTPASGTVVAGSNISSTTAAGSGGGRTSRSDVGRYFRLAFVMHQLGSKHEVVGAKA